MSKIVNIGTAVPLYAHNQDDILQFMQRVFALDEGGKRKLRFLYKQAGISTRYSVIPDYSLDANQWEFYPPTENLEPFPGIEARMKLFRDQAPQLSINAINNCITEEQRKDITHLITVSCTGLSAPGLELEIIEQLGLNNEIQRTAVNFMGCYAAVHALKLADAFCKAEKEAKVLIVCTELCTLHFQKEPTIDVMTSSMLFADGAAAVLVDNGEEGLSIDSFYSTIISKGKKDMAWEVSASGFRMTLSGYIPDLIGQDFKALVDCALSKHNNVANDIDYWCIHPGGKKILESVHHSLGFSDDQLDPCYKILKDFGNMSSATILFVLKELISMNPRKGEKIFGAAFGPGLSVETFTLSA